METKQITDFVASTEQVISAPNGMRIYTDDFVCTSGTGAGRIGDLNWMIAGISQPNINALQPGHIGVHALRVQNNSSGGMYLGTSITSGSFHVADLYEMRWRFRSLSNVGTYTCRFMAAGPFALNVQNLNLLGFGWDVGDTHLHMYLAKNNLNAKIATSLQLVAGTWYDVALYRFGNSIQLWEDSIGPLYVQPENEPNVPELSAQLLPGVYMAASGPQANLIVDFFKLKLLATPIL